MGIAFLDVRLRNSPLLGLNTYLRVPALSKLTVIIVPTVNAWTALVTGEST